MLYKLVLFLKNFFGKATDNAVQEVPQEKSGFSIEHKWPFPSNPPENPDYLINELIRGVFVEGDHVYYWFKNQKRRHLRNEKGNETHQARHIVWWMEGRSHPPTASGLTTTCGEPKCIKLSHIKLNTPEISLGPKNNPRPPKANHVAKVKQPPLPPRPKNRVQKAPEKPTLEKGDRSKCITAKVYFPNKQEAQSKAHTLNSPKIRGKGRRVYPYDTPCPYCFGWHLTKIKPGNYQKQQIKNSAY